MRDGKVVGILQARMSSTRLPGKVLKPLCGEPMLARQLERLTRSRRMDALVVATSDRSDDDPIAEVCSRLGISCYRGSLSDVLDRFYRAAAEAGADHVVRLTGDCPLTDPGLIDDLIDFYLRQEVDYASNCRPPTLPDGLDAEVFSMAALRLAWQDAEDPFFREHVVPFIVRNPQRFSAANWQHETDLSALRWTVDEPSDLAFVEEVFNALYPRKPDFSWRDVLDLLDENPDLLTINTGIERNEGSKRK